MKTLIFLLISIILISCSPATKTEGGTKVWNNTVDPPEVIVHDSCEYVIFWFSNATWGSHKGNCKNPIHIYYISEDQVSEISRLSELLNYRLDSIKNIQK